MIRFISVILPKLKYQKFDDFFGDSMQIGKYIGYAIFIIVVIFVLEWFQIVDVPFFEIPDFLSGKTDMVHSTEDVLEQVK